jgi:pilus assembly protein CpaC
MKFRWKPWAVIWLAGLLSFGTAPAEADAPLLRAASGMPNPWGAGQAPLPQDEALHLHEPLTAMSVPARLQRSGRKRAKRPHAAARAVARDDTATLAVGAGSLLHLPRPAATVFIADPTIADVQVPNPAAVFVLGKKAGTTTVYALDASGGTLLRRTIVVVHNLDALQQILAQRFPSLHLDLKSAPGSLMVSGSVPNAAVVAAVTETLQGYLDHSEKLINQLTLSSPTQVNLRVRIAEVQRTVLQQIGVNWWAMGSYGGLMSGRQLLNYSTTPTTWQLPSNSGFMALIGSESHGGVLDLLDQESLVTTLAEPNLTAVSGETASFLAGGEYPIPVAQSSGSSSGNNTITVQYKDFGVGLNFTPTVTASDRISLKVRPEVSELDSNNSVTTGGVTIPGLSVRRVETTVELGSGESFVIGGLLQNTSRNVLSQMPGLGNLPILGRLFSSTDYQNSKSELVVIVTPYLVRPVGPGQLQTPQDHLYNPSQVEQVLQRQAHIDPYNSNGPRLSGSAGFVY